METVGNRVKVTLMLSMENASWVAQVAKELDLPVSRVVNLCVEGERCSLLGNTSRGLAKLIVAIGNERGGGVQGTLALEG